ncbi:hypothetical protein COLO4_26807 [Corchorus olitorius]|uniref:Uncharacterized protein n=1 Tax=Corchorus olitorius TaxID=93759 RepID=A0A1R3HU19_9ROSI|nr:hypothetical protein COLO4_26807 [Corchorus olitorius]
MRNQMLALDLWDHVSEEKEKEEATPTKQRNQQEEYKALVYIQNALSDEIFVTVMNCTTARQAWEIIRNEYGGISTIMNLRRDFETLRMGKDETVQEYADRIVTIVNKLKLYGDDDEYTESKIVMKIITTLPRRFEMNILALGPSPGEPSPPLIQVVTHLLVHVSAFLDLGRWILAFLQSLDDGDAQSPERVSGMLLNVSESWGTSAAPATAEPETITAAAAARKLAAARLQHLRRLYLLIW